MPRVHIAYAGKSGLRELSLNYFRYESFYAEGGLKRLVAFGEIALGKIPWIPRFHIVTIQSAQVFVNPADFRLDFKKHGLESQEIVNFGEVLAEKNQQTFQKLLRHLLREKARGARRPRLFFYNCADGKLVLARPLEPIAGVIVISFGIEHFSFGED